MPAEARTLEALAEHALPSEPGESLSSIILGKISVLASNEHPVEFPEEFCKSVIMLWAQCLDEKHVSGSLVHLSE
jgi:hypothetical protein